MDGAVPEDRGGEEMDGVEEMIDRFSLLGRQAVVWCERGKAGVVGYR